jgi:hypothetical protein
LASVQSSDKSRRALRKGRIAIRLGFLFYGLLVAWNTFLNAPDYFQRRDWWGFFWLVSPFIAMLLSWSATQREAERRWLGVPGKALTLRTKLADEELVPPAADQPAPLGGDELPLTPTRIGPLKRWKASMIVSAIFSVFFLLLGLGSGWGFLFLLALPESGFQAGPDFPLIEFISVVITFSLIVLFLCGLGIAFLIAAWRAPRGSTVIADDWGLRWRKGGWGHKSHAALAWHDVQGFYFAAYQSKKAGAYKAYLLDSCDTAFLWRLIPRAAPAELAASEYLSRLIVTRARLPLRDLSSLLTSVVSQEPTEATAGAPANTQQL